MMILPVQIEILFWVLLEDRGTLVRGLSWKWFLHFSSDYLAFVLLYVLLISSFFLSSTCADSLPPMSYKNLILGILFQCFPDMWGFN